MIFFAFFAGVRNDTRREQTTIFVPLLRRRYALAAQASQTAQKSHAENFTDCRREDSENDAVMSVCAVRGGV